MLTGQGHDGMGGRGAKRACASLGLAVLLIEPGNDLTINGGGSRHQSSNNDSGNNGGPGGPSKSAFLRSSPSLHPPLPPLTPLSIPP